jgi:hypothetical protein
MMQFNRLRCLLLLLFIVTVGNANADWINLTGAETAPNIAEIYIHDDHVKVQLEIYPGDLKIFKELIPDDWLKQQESNRLPLDERLKHFSRHTLVITNENGEPLQMQLAAVEARTRIDRRSRFAGMINPFTRQRVPEPPADKRVLYAELIYLFDEKPKRLQFIPPLNEQGTAKTTIGFVVYHKSVPVTDFRYLGQASTLMLDWQDPWFTKFDNRNLTRHHKYPIMLYLYVEPRQIRLDALMRISDLVEMTGLPADITGDNAEARRNRLHDHIKEYFSRNDAIQVDGETRLPDSTIIRYFKVSLKGLEPVENVSPADESSLLVGVSRKYYVPELPQSIGSTWPYFNQQFDRVPFVATDPAGPFPDYIFQDDAAFDWNNMLKQYEEPAMRSLDVTTGWRIEIPYIGVKTLFNRTPDKQQASAIISNVFENLRIAYIEKNPPALSQALDSVIDHNQNDSLTAELSKLFAPSMRRGGFGAVESFGDLEINAIQPLDEPDGFRATVTGSAVIQAMHWGHTDQQQLQFQMLLDLVDINNQWQLSDLTVIDLKEIK